MDVMVVGPCVSRGDDKDIVRRAHEIVDRLIERGERSPCYSPIVLQRLEFSRPRLVRCEKQDQLRGFPPVEPIEMTAQLRRGDGGGPDLRLDEEPTAARDDRVRDPLTALRRLVLEMDELELRLLQQGTEEAF